MKLKEILNETLKEQMVSGEQFHILFQKYKIVGMTINGDQEICVLTDVPAIVPNDKAELLMTTIIGNNSDLLKYLMLHWEAIREDEIITGDTTHKQLVYMYTFRQWVSELEEEYEWDYYGGSDDFEDE